MDESNNIVDDSYCSGARPAEVQDHCDLGETPAIIREQRNRFEGTLSASYGYNMSKGYNETTISIHLTPDEIDLLEQTYPGATFKTTVVNKYALNQ